jgi:hypothetical protein
MKRAMILLASVILSCFCAFRMRNPAFAAALPVGSYEIRGVYAGTLPCSGCDAVATALGIPARLELEDPGPNLGLGSGTFTLTERHVSVRGDIVTKIRGQWSLTAVPAVAPRDPHPSSGFIKLTPDDKAARPLYFYVADGRELHKLDDSLRELPSDLPHVLLKMLTMADGREYPVVPGSMSPVTPSVSRSDNSQQ